MTAKKKKTFICGGNLPDGTRFEEGDEVPANLSTAEIKSLEANGCIEVKQKESE